MSVGAPRRAPFDRRLWREEPALRRGLALSVGVGGLGAAALVGQALGLGRLVAALVLDHAAHRLVVPALTLVVVASVARALLAALGEIVGLRSARAVEDDLRRRVLERLLDAAGPGSEAPEREQGRDVASARRPPSTGAGARAELAVLLGHGLDSLDDYVSRCLPRLVLAAVVPALALAAIGLLDPLSLLVLVVVLALLPLFLTLVGRVSASRVSERWRALTGLSGQFLDAVRGLETLRAFGRTQVQRGEIRKATDRLRRSTLAALRDALLSSLVLELLASVGTALVAVPLGLRLVSGRIGLAVAVSVLVLTPEVFLPIRRAAAAYHATAEAGEVLERVWAVLDDRSGPRRVGVPTLSAIRSRAPMSCRATGQGGQGVRVELVGVAVRAPGQETPLLEGVDLAIPRCGVVALAGPSGVGKTSLVRIVLGLLRPDGGRVLVEGHDLVDLDLGWWRSLVAWVPERPALAARTISAYLATGAPDVATGEMWAALERAALADAVAALPGGLDAELAPRLESLSAGERQRLALARALLRRQAALLVVDEPTAHLDEETAGAVIEGLRAALGGRSGLLVSHDPRVLALADEVVTLEPPAEAVPTGAAAPLGPPARRVEASPALAPARRPAAW
jgi:ATP-binding cassette subfamily C protein CydCD